MDIVSIGVIIPVSNGGYLYRYITRVYRDIVVSGIGCICKGLYLQYKGYHPGFTSIMGCNIPRDGGLIPGVYIRGYSLYAMVPWYYRGYHSVYSMVLPLLLVLYGF